MKLNRVSILVLMGLVLAGCGEQSPPPPAAAGQEAAQDSDGFGICRMLSAAQVASVLPGSDSGSVTQDGGSLIEGVDSYQCSYTAVRGAEVDLLTLIVTVAADDARFAQIEVSGFAFDEDDAVAVGNSGWKKDDNADEYEIVANKGRSVLRINLMAPGAQGRSEQMLALAQAVAARL